MPGEVLHLRHSATVAAGVPVRWLSVSYPLTGRSVDQPIDLTAGRPATRDVDQTLPADAPLGQPYWLREEHSVGLFKVNPALIGQPENPPAFPVEHRFQVGGQTLEIADVPVQAAEQGQPARRLDVIAPVALRPLSEVRLFAPGAERPVDVEVTAARDGAAGTLALRAPDGWTVTPASQPFRLATAGDRVAVVVHRQGPVRIGYGRHHGRGPRGRPDLEHRSGRDPARAYPRAVAPAPRALKVLTLDLAIKGRRVGYIPGAGDSVAEGLEEMGYEVTRLAGADLTPEKLAGLDAVVIGVRAYNVRDDLAAHLPALFAYVEGGGTVVAQYNRPNGLRTNRLAPYDLRLSDARVTDENAAGDFPRARPPRAHDAQQDQRGRHGRLGAGARHLLPDAMGLAFHADPGVGRPGRNAAEGGPARGEARPRPLRLHGARVLPAIARRGARGLPALRQPGLARQMTIHDDDRAGPPHPPDPADEPPDGATGLPWPRTWPGVYAVVLICFVAWVVLLVVLERSFS